MPAVRKESYTLSGITRSAQPLTFDDRDYDPLLGEIGEARLVLIGESSHGTHEFYRERARITRRLIEEKNFEARLPEQFDAVIHIDRTHALIPLETSVPWHEGEGPGNLPLKRLNQRNR